MQYKQNNNIINFFHNPDFEVIRYDIIDPISIITSKSLTVKTAFAVKF